MKLSALAVFLVLSCTTQQPATQSQPAQTSSSQPEAWSVRYESSGGITGRGMGDVTIASDGTLSVHSMNGNSCADHASDAETKQIAAVVSRAWREAAEQQSGTKKEKEPPCCDMITYTMTIDVGGAQRSVTWGEDASKLPQYTRSLAAAMDALRGGHVGQCS